MHVLHEGVARRLIMYYFQLWKDQKRTGLSELNYKLSSFCYGYTHVRNKLKRLSEADLKKKNLIISLGQMHSLVLLFPIIFCDILDTTAPEYMQSYYTYCLYFCLSLLNLFRKIMMACTMYNIDEIQVKLLERRIAKFILIWEKSFSCFPKVHYLIHIPRAIRE